MPSKETKQRIKKSFGQVVFYISVLPMIYMLYLLIIDQFAWMNTITLALGIVLIGISVLSSIYAEILRWRKVYPQLILCTLLSFATFYFPLLIYFSFYLDQLSITQLTVMGVGTLCSLYSIYESIRLFMPEFNRSFMH